MSEHETHAHPNQAMDTPRMICNKVVSHVWHALPFCGERIPLKEP